MKSNKFTWVFICALTIAHICSFVDAFLLARDTHENNIADEFSTYYSLLLPRLVKRQATHGVSQGINENPASKLETTIAQKTLLAKSNSENSPTKNNNPTAILNNEIQSELNPSQVPTNMILVPAATHSTGTETLPVNNIQQLIPVDGSHNIMTLPTGDGQQNVATLPAQMPQNIINLPAQGQQNILPLPAEGQQNILTLPVEGQQNIVAVPSEGSQNTITSTTGLSTNNVQIIPAEHEFGNLPAEFIQSQSIPGQLVQNQLPVGEQSVYTIQDSGDKEVNRQGGWGRGWGAGGRGRGWGSGGTGRGWGSGGTGRGWGSRSIGRGWGSSGDMSGGWGLSGGWGSSGSMSRGWGGHQYGGWARGWGSGKGWERRLRDPKSKPLTGKRKTNNLIWTPDGDVYWCDEDVCARLEEVE